MQLEYDLAEADYRIAQRFAVRGVRRRNGKRSLLINLGVWVVIAILVNAALDGPLRSSPWSSTGFVYGFFFALALVLGGALVVIWRVRGKQIHALAPFPISHTVCLQSDGLTVSNRYCDSRMAWNVFTAIEQLPAHVGLLFRAGAATVIPNHAFASDHTRAEFILAVLAGMADASV